MFTFTKSWTMDRYRGLLTSINLPTSWDDERIYNLNNVFSNSTSLTNIKGDGILKIGGNSTFQSCTQLTTVSFKNCLTLYGSNTFKSCVNLANVNLQAINYLGPATFQGCSKITSLSLPFCTYIGSNCFRDCLSLSSLTAETCETIGSYAFATYSEAQAKNIPLPLLSSWSFPMLYELYTGNCFSGPSFHLRAFSANGGGCDFENVTSIYVQSTRVSYYKTGILSSYSSKVFAENNDNEYIYPYEYYDETVTTIPAGKLNCKGIGHAAFLFASVSLGSNYISFPNCSFIGGGAFTASGFMTNALSTLDFPNVTHIGSISSGTIIFSSNRYGTLKFPSLQVLPHWSMFGSSPKYKEIHLNSVKEVPMSFFYDCSALISINLDSCELLGTGAFAGCSSLTSLNLPECRIISSQAFFNCQSLATFSAPKVKYIDMSAFKNASTITTLNLPECKIMGGFDNAWNLETVSLPNCSMVNGLKNTPFASNQVTMSQRAYHRNGKGDISLISVDSVLQHSSSFNETTATHIAGGLFDNYEGTQEITWLTTTANSIGPECFRLCAQLFVAEIDDCTIVDYCAFQGCTSLAEVYADNLSFIGDKAFYNCTSLSGIKLSNCSYIGQSAFCNCYSMSWGTTLTSCKIIDNFAFQQCSSLATISLPNIARVGAYAFSQCTRLSTVYLTGSRICEVGTYAFYSCSALTSIYVPSSLYSEYMKSTHGLYRYSTMLVSV